jgi:hypothetical protein
LNSRFPGFPGISRGFHFQDFKISDVWWLCL